ncbi:MAG: CoA pyrophosphatase [Brachymonas sp.]|nr:CoA pyrophosphatase [Brachymonas sp.]
MASLQHTALPTTLPFNPRDLPVWAEATHALQQQAAVAAARLQADALRQRFAAPPAWQAEPHNDRWPATAHIPRAAAVLIGLQALGTDDGALHVLLTQRGQHLDAHPGQIAFPGGKIDANDAHATAAALREAQEEVCLHPAQVQVLGELLPYETGTGYRVTPVVALLHASATLQPNPQEVSDVFLVPLDFLMNPANHRKHLWQPGPGQRREWFSMPYFDTASRQERFIWGVTAGILRDLYRFLSA